LIGGSGALLVFETQIDQALNPKLAKVTPTGTMPSLNELKVALERQYPGYRVLDFGISDSDDTAYGAYLEPASGHGLDLAVDQYSGKALGVWAIIALRVSCTAFTPISLPERPAQRSSHGAPYFSFFYPSPD